MKTTEQAVKFGIVGALNTAVDFFILNILVYFGLLAAFSILGQKFLVANVISVSVAMINSFILNKKWAFKSEGGNIYFQIFQFLIVTIIGMFVVHQIIFNLLYYRFVFPADFAVKILHYIGLTFFSREFILLNFSKSVAIVVSLIWNFIGYKFVVFKAKEIYSGSNS